MEAGTDNRGAQALRALLASTSQSELAERANISQSHLSRLSRAEVKPKLLAQALSLEALGIPVEWWDEPALDSNAELAAQPSDPPRAS